MVANHEMLESHMNTLDAPRLQVSQWLNTDEPFTLDDLRGRVVVLHAFQLLCPGGVAHGLPQAARLHQLFPASELVVLGLHTVFEHHAVMGPEALRVFLAEYRIAFPVGIDCAGAGALPLTMQDYALQGTPSVVLLDRQGRIRLNHFGQIDDLALGAAIGQLLAEAPGAAARSPAREQPGAPAAQDCADGVCTPASRP
jgi:hypothetical protein